MNISPFSLEHKWAVYWERLRSNFRADPRVNIHSMREKKALEALSAVGVIGEKQLSRLFSLSTGEVDNMKRTFKIMKHKLKRGESSEISIYTLGIRGAMALKLDAYESNYWTTYTIEDVMKRLLFFQLYHYFPKLKLLPAPSPFIASLLSNDNIINVYIMKGNAHDLLHYLKWESRSNHRLMIVTESMNHLVELEMFLPKLKVRIALEEDLMNQTEVKDDIFYFYDEEGELVR